VTPPEGDRFYRNETAAAIWRDGRRKLGCE
jgi:hypothetical protein